MQGTVTFSSLNISEGTGETKMILTATGTAGAGDEGSASFSNITIHLKGKELENGNLEISAARVAKQGTVTYNAQGTQGSIDLSKRTELDKDLPIDPALTLTPQGFNYKASGRGSDYSGSGEITGVLSGNTLTLTGTGSGSGSGSSAEGGKGTLTLTRR